MSFEEAINAGGIITQNRMHARNENFSVKVQLPTSQIFTYTNVSRQRLQPHVADLPTVAPPASESRTPTTPSQTPRATARESFDDAMRAGGRICEVKQFATFGVYLQCKDGRIIHCWNISQDRLQAALSRGVRNVQSFPTGTSRPTSSGNPCFEDCIADNATIKKTMQHVFYSVHVIKANGKVENFNRVSADKYEAWANRTESGVPLVPPASQSPIQSHGLMLPGATTFYGQSMSLPRRSSQTHGQGFMPPPEPFDYVQPVPPAPMSQTNQNGTSADGITQLRWVYPRQQGITHDRSTYNCGHAVSLPTTYNGVLERPSHTVRRASTNSMRQFHPYAVAVPPRRSSIGIPVDPSVQQHLQGRAPGNTQYLYRELHTHGGASTTGDPVAPQEVTRDVFPAMQCCGEVTTDTDEEADTPTGMETPAVEPMQYNHEHGAMTQDDISVGQYVGLAQFESEGSYTANRNGIMAEMQGQTMNEHNVGLDYQCGGAAPSDIIHVGFTVPNGLQTAPIFVKQENDWESLALNSVKTEDHSVAYHDSTGSHTYREYVSDSSVYGQSDPYGFQNAQEQTQTQSHSFSPAQQAEYPTGAVESPDSTTVEVATYDQDLYDLNFDDEQGEFDDRVALESKPQQREHHNQHGQAGLVSRPTPNENDHFTSLLKTAESSGLHSAPASVGNYESLGLDVDPRSEMSVALERGLQVPPAMSPFLPVLQATDATEW
ncbi:hypothetical protein HDU85_004615 [Gaertneriomyces sp. JEL0708]|nr:hypothetical protein HDU85_004615 [Gaertneriomyces sp. JEL0708]